MNIQKTAQGDTHELLVSGRIDGEGANQLEVALLATIAAGAKHITVELSEATFLCSAGLRALLQYWRQMQNKGGSLHVTNPSPEASTLLNTSGFKDMLIQKM
jgi:anti-sigma B factor antagonist